MIRSRRMMKVASPWSPYGLTSDPFFQTPLGTEVPGDTEQDIALFVGRDAEITLLGRQIVGSTSSRAIVQGAPGVGKTSVVNKLKAVLADQQLSDSLVVSHREPVRVVSGMTVHDFTVDVLRVLLQIHATQHTTGRVREADPEMAFWTRIGRMLNGEDTVGAGISVGGFGLTREPGRIAAERPSVSLYDELAQAFAYLARSRHSRVLVHVNNLENLSVHDTQHAAFLFQQLRDYFLIPHSHWIFVGTTGIEAHIFRRTPQVSGIIPVAITLDPLTTQDVVELLTLRYQHLARGTRWLPPVSDTAAERLYHRYHGDLRNFLRLLSHAVQRTAVTDPPTPLSETAVIATMAPVYQRELSTLASEGDIQTLSKLVTGQPPHFTFRVTDLRAQGIGSQATASRLIDRLAQAGVLVFDHTEGRSTYYRLSGDATIAFGLGVMNSE